MKTLEQKISFYFYKEYYICLYIIYTSFLGVQCKIEGLGEYYLQYKWSAQGRGFVIKYNIRIFKNRKILSPIGVFEVDFHFCLNFSHSIIRLKQVMTL